MEAMRALNFGRRKPGEVPRTFWLPDSEVLDETLCTVCRRLDIRAIVTQPVHPPEYAVLGFYPDIRKRAADCRFCQLIVSTITSGWESILDRGWDSCSNLEQVECALNRKLWINIFPLPPEAKEAKLHSGLIERCQLDLLGDDAVKVGMADKPLFHARLIPNEVADLKMMHEWLRICKEYHTETCGKEIAEYIHKVPKSLRVIDVESMRLVPASSRMWLSSKNLPYVALSYVWGNVSSVDLYKTTKDNFRQRTKRGGLKDVPFPRSIRDAIETTRRLGERYIWVDAVCIIQDSPEDKGDQIGSMHIVYGAATFTIVAAGGDNAECPLPRSHNGSPHRITQNVVDINGLHVTQPTPTLWDVERTPTFSPKWFSRGWTYQERHLPARLFLFTTHQVYFQCRVACHSEGRITERYSSKKYDERSDPSTWGNTIGKSEGPVDPYHYMNSYQQMIHEYTARQLGFDSDALNAFMGVANVLEDQYGELYKLHYGLPGPDIEEAMTWQPAQIEPLVRRPDFPSWSWAGWRGRVRYSGSFAMNWMVLDGAQRPLTHPVPEFVVHTETGSVAMRRQFWMRQDFSGGNREISQGKGALKPYGVLPPFPDDTGLPKQLNPPPPPGTLDFMAVVVPAESFTLIRGDEHYSDCQCFDGNAKAPPLTAIMWRVVGRDGLTCGMFGNDVGFLEYPEPSKDDPDAIEAAKVMAAAGNGGVKMAFVCIARSGSWGTSNTCPGYDPSKYKKADGCCWEILLVKYGTIHNNVFCPNVAERIAAGRIHEDAWAEAEGAKWERVLLR